MNSLSYRLHHMALILANRSGKLRTDCILCDDSDFVSDFRIDEDDDLRVDSDDRRRHCLA